MVECCQAFSQCLSRNTSPSLTVLKVRLIEKTGTDNFRDTQFRTVVEQSLLNLKQCPQV